MDLLGISASSLQPVILAGPALSGLVPGEQVHGHTSLHQGAIATAIGGLSSPPTTRRSMEAGGLLSTTAGASALSSAQRGELQLARVRAEKATAGTLLGAHEADGCTVLPRKCSGACIPA